ncbi:MAG: glycosyltransferase [Flavobacteriales bacterium]|nr:glycosyltransferase [Flavobacteriales bacterium]
MNSLLRIAIATPSRDTWSETFIAAHLERLKEVVLVLSDGSLPYTANGAPMLTPRSLSGRLVNVFEQRVRKKSNAILLRERITKELRHHRTDVLLAEYGPTAEELIKSARAAGVPLVAHFHGYDAHKKAPLERYGNYKRLFYAAAAIVVVSRAMEQQMLALGAPASGCTTSFTARIQSVSLPATRQRTCRTLWPWAASPIKKHRSSPCWPSGKLGGNARMHGSPW